MGRRVFCANLARFAWQAAPRTPHQAQPAGFHTDLPRPLPHRPMISLLPVSPAKRRPTATYSAERASVPCRPRASLPAAANNARGRQDTDTHCVEHVAVGRRFAGETGSGKIVHLAEEGTVDRCDTGRAAYVAVCGSLLSQPCKLGVCGGGDWTRFTLDGVAAAVARRVGG